MPLQICQIWQKVTKKAFYSSIRFTIVIALLVVSTECTTMKIKDHWVRYYDPKLGTEIEDIQKNFNLHRGRWWNYYDRGSVYLAYGHYDKAYEDFVKAAAKRSLDKWDARTYGMHFIDYFPHRETGVTYYFQGKQETDMANKEKLLKDAIDELETSLDQEESSRAKFYLNEARTTLLQVTKEKDKIPPTIHVNKPIYTNQQLVRFNITVTDQDSYVKDIQIGSSCGEVHIDKPKLLVELAKKKIERTVELTVGPNDKYAVVAITATDLAGNKSNPDNTLIIVDKQAPTAGLDIVGNNIRPDSPVEVSIEAMDLFGLKQIQVGDDPNNKIDCDGAVTYSCNITGMPRNGDLAITVVDNAGNTVLTSIPVRKYAVQDNFASSKSHNSQRSQLAKASNVNWLLSPAYSSVLGFPMPRGLMSNNQRAYDGIYPPTAVRAQASSVKDQTIGPTFVLPPHVFQLGGKETSQDVFYFDGTLLNAESVDKIVLNVRYKVDGKTKDIPYEIKKSETLMAKQNMIFNEKIDINDVPVNGSIDMTVEAYCKSDAVEPCSERNVIIKKSKLSTQEPNAIYGILLLPFRSDSSTSKSTVEDNSKLNHVYHVFLESLRNIHISDLETQKSLKRFNIYDVNVIGDNSETTEWYALEKHDYHRKKNKIVRALRNRQNSEERKETNVIDLVIFGDVKLSSTDGEERIEIKLWATNISSEDGDFIRFPGSIINDKRIILADVYGKTKELQEYIDLLAFKVGESFPRLQADIIKVDRKKKIIEINRGERHRLFTGMKLCLYENSTRRNRSLKKICFGEISNLDWYSCQIKPQVSTTQIGPNDMVITK